MGSRRIVHLKTEKAQWRVGLAAQIIGGFDQAQLEVVMTEETQFRSEAERLLEEALSRKAEAYAVKQKGYWEEGCLEKREERKALLFEALDLMGQAIAAATKQAAETPNKDSYDVVLRTEREYNQLVIYGVKIYIPD